MGNWCLLPPKGWEIGGEIADIAAVIPLISSFQGVMCGTRKKK